MITKDNKKSFIYTFLGAVVVALMAIVLFQPNVYGDELGETQMLELTSSGVTLESVTEKISSSNPLRTIQNKDNLFSIYYDKNTDLTEIKEELAPLAYTGTTVMSYISTALPPTEINTNISWMLIAIFLICGLYFVFSPGPQNRTVKLALGLNSFVNSTFITIIIIGIIFFISGIGLFDINYWTASLIFSLALMNFIFGLVVNSHFILNIEYESQKFLSEKYIDWIIKNKKNYFIILSLVTIPFVSIFVLLGMPVILSIAFIVIDILLFLFQIIIIYPYILGIIESKVLNISFFQNSKFWSK